MTLLDEQHYYAPTKSSSKSTLEVLKYCSPLLAFGALALLVNGFFIYSPFLQQEDDLYVRSSALGANLDVPLVDTCDVAKGQWIFDPSPPLYTNATCKHIQGHQNCLKNGRPDRGFLSWHWKPDGCDLPKFDSSAFLEFMRGKNMVFLGDSIARNHMQSLLCALSQVESPKNLYRDKDDKDLKWLFPTYNFTVSIFWTPYLVKHVRELDSNGTTIIHLHLDTPEEVWKSLLATYDMAIVSTGPWFFRGTIYYLNNTVIGCHHCSRDLNKFSFADAYRIALGNTLKAISEHPGYKGITILRTFSVEHFEHGEWWNGGYCNRSEPYRNQSSAVPWMPSEMRRIQVEEFNKAQVRGTVNGSKMKLMDITYSAFMRPDGHPGIYRTPNHTQGTINDCLHWCLPGPIDMWNQIIFRMMLLNQV